MLQILPNEKPIVISPTMVAIAGDLVVGSLLSRIVQWHLPNKNGQSKLRVVRQGKFWIAKPRDQWMAECGLSLEQYKRGIKVLKAKGLIETKQMIYGDKNVTHLRLVDGAFGSPVPLMGVATCNPLPQNGKGLHFSGGKNATDLIGSHIRQQVGQQIGQGTEDPGTDRAGEEAEVRIEIAAAVTGVPIPEDPRKDEDEEDDPGPEDESPQTVEIPPFVPLPPLKEPPIEPPVHANGHAMNVKDVLASVKLTQGHGNNLGALWKNRVHLVYGGTQKMLTGTEVGQLARLKKILEHDVEPVLTWAVEHWPSFAAEAGARAGTPWPSHPSIGFLVKHAHVAQELKNPPAVSPFAESMAGPLQSVASSPPTESPPHSADDAPYQPVKGELAALIAGLKE